MNDPKLKSRIDSYNKLASEEGYNAEKAKHEAEKLKHPGTTYPATFEESQDFRN